MTNAYDKLYDSLPGHENTAGVSGDDKAKLPPEFLDIIRGVFGDGSGAPSLTTRGKEPPEFEVARVPWAKGSPLENQRLRREYRAWWKETLRTPYGFCGCGCGVMTRRAGWTGRERGYVCGEPLPFLPRHRERWGYPDLTDPFRLCACGCGRPTPVVRRGRRDEEGRPREFAGGRGEYLNRDHRPPEYAPYLTLTTPLGETGETEEGGESPLLSDEDVDWLAEIADRHLSFVRDRGRVHVKIHLADEETVVRFYDLTRRGRVYGCEPTREGDGPSTCWTTRNPLEAANLLRHLKSRLGEDARHEADLFLEKYEFEGEQKKRERPPLDLRGRRR